jgi:regulatory protein
VSDTSSNHRDPLDLAARALRHRDRTRQEVDERLSRAGVADAARTEALETLERLGYVDDARFAAGRAEALAERGYGDDAIRHALAEAGVADDRAAEALAALEPEAERARLLVARLGATAKTLAGLRRKGFSEDTLDGLDGFAEVGAQA